MNHTPVPSRTACLTCPIYQASLANDAVSADNGPIPSGVFLHDQDKVIVANVVIPDEPRAATSTN